MALQATTEVLVTSNKSRNLVFFPGGLSAADDSVICFNYKTGQWTSCSDYDGIGTFSVNKKTRDIGLVRFSSGSVDLQEQFTTYPESTGTIESASRDVFPGARAVIDGVRPIVGSGTVAVRVGTQDLISDSVTYSTGTSVNSRSGMSNFRDASNPAEGRYLRVEFSLSGTWDQVLGADVDLSDAGRV